MAKQNAKPNEAPMAEAVSKTEMFFGKHGKLIIGIVVVILLAVGGWFGYKHFVVQPREEAAKRMLADAQYYLNGTNPDYAAALDGLLAITGDKKYKSTAAGNLAKHYAGICYLHTGDLQNAAKYLSEFSTVEGIPGQIINAQNYGLQGDVAVELGEYDKAVSLYTKAVNASDNIYTTPLYLRKQALVLRAQGKNDEARQLLQRILNNYSDSVDALEIQKLIGTLK